MEASPQLTLNDWLKSVHANSQQSAVRPESARKAPVRPLSARADRPASARADLSVPTPPSFSRPVGTRPASARAAAYLRGQNAGDPVTQRDADSVRRAKRGPGQLDALLQVKLKEYGAAAKEAANVLAAKEAELREADERAANKAAAEKRVADKAAQRAVEDAAEQKAAADAGKSIAQRRLERSAQKKAEAEEHAKVAARAEALRRAEHPTSRWERLFVSLTENARRRGISSQNTTEAEIEESSEVQHDSPHSKHVQKLLAAARAYHNDAVLRFVVEQRKEAARLARQAVIARFVRGLPS